MSQHRQIGRRTFLCSVATALGAARTPCLASSEIHRSRSVGADASWVTYQAEDMHTLCPVLGPFYVPYRVETESSRQRCVKLSARDFVEFKVRSAANAMVVRYSLPDSADGTGLDSAIDIFRNGVFLRRLRLTSGYAWLYGAYPFTNNPADGNPRKFYDEARCKGFNLKAGDVVRLQKTADAADYCIIDFVDLENIAPPLPQPAGSLSVREFGAIGDGRSDDTVALCRCLAEATVQGKVAWVPAGDYVLTSDVDLHDGSALQGAGMWHTTFIGDEGLYADPQHRLRFKIVGEHCRLADFALLGKLRYRNDQERNDGILGIGARSGVISRLWIEHTKVGMWFYNSHDMRIEDCRLRNTLADGINLCLGVRNSVIENCSARGTGDDCFAIWPTVSDQGLTEDAPHPGGNVIRRCTGELPYLANGGAIYGGNSNRIEYCLFRDISAGCGILFSTTFPTYDKTADNNFSGQTVARHCRVVRSGGYDHDWAWRGAVELCIDRKSIRGVDVDDVRIEDSLSDGLRIVETATGPEARALYDTRFVQVAIGAVGLGTDNCHAMTVTEATDGSLTLIDCDIHDIKNYGQHFRIFRM